MTESGRNELSPLEQLVGPFYDIEGAMQVLDVSREDLTRLADLREVLALNTGDGTVVFPVWQFTSAGTVVTHLSEVVTILASGTTDSWSWAMWLSSVAEGEWDGLSAWQFLAAGNPPDGVISEACRDAARWRQ